MKAIQFKMFLFLMLMPIMASANGLIKNPTEDSTLADESFSMDAEESVREVAADDSEPSADLSGERDIATQDQLSNDGADEALPKIQYWEFE